MIQHIDLCQAIADWLNETVQQEKFENKFTAVRANLPITELETTNEVVVTVFPGPRTWFQETRDDWRVLMQVFVAQQQKISANTIQEELAAQDVMMRDTQVIENLLKSESFLGIERYEEQEQTKPPYSPAELENDQQFISVTGATYYQLVD